MPHKLTLLMFLLYSCPIALPALSALELSTYPKIGIKADNPSIVWVDSSQKEVGRGSHKSPFSSITNALKAAKRDQTIVLKEGVYREKIVVHGNKGNQINGIIAQPGTSVLVTGNAVLDNWQKHSDKIYKATLSHAPLRLTKQGREQSVSRFPSSGWVASTSVGDDFLTCPGLKGLKFETANTKAYVWTKHGNQFHKIDLLGFDPETGKVNLKITSKWQKFTNGDKLYLYNNERFISEPGQWAYQKSTEGFTVYYQAKNTDDLKLIETPTPGTNSVIGGAFLNNFTLAGLDISGSGRDGINIGHNSKNITVAHCRVYDNTRYGISTRQMDGLTIRNNIATLNYNSGISLHTVTNGKIFQNEIGMNFVDGLIITWNTNNIDVENNYIHRHLFWGHPDNLQMYRGVKNIRFRNNFMFTSGQGLMTEQTSDCLFEGNLLVGTVANSVIFGHRSSSGWTINNNTFAYSGYSNMAFTDKDYRVERNIFVVGHPGISYKTANIKNYSGVKNLFWHGKGLEGKGKILASDKGWHSSIEEFQSATKTDLDSIYKDPQFTNAPAWFTVIDGNRLSECTEDTYHLRAKGLPTTVGDFIEINFDGVKRQITKVSGQIITVTPGLKERPLKSWLIANWKDQEDYTLDFSTKPTSPVMEDGQQVIGSTLNAKDYIAGDFDGDGTRDLPQALPQLEEAIESFR